MATVVTLIVVAVLAMASGAQAQLNSVNAFEFDPADSGQIKAEWTSEIGCPDCSPAPADGRKMGLLLAKTGPTITFNAAAGAHLRGVNGLVITEIGWDVRTGTHCGAGAPRFNITTQADVVYMIGCASPPPSSTTSPSPSIPDGWKRLRYDVSQAFNASNGFVQDGGLVGAPVKTIEIIFDEGQDASGGPDMSGLVILDNITLNGVMIGKP
jgi:hypothetical protein